MPNKLTRSQTIFKVLEDFQKFSGDSWATIATNIAQAYNRTTPEQLREIEFHNPEDKNKDTYKAMRANAQIITRMMSGEVRLPCDLEEAIELSLPENWQVEMRSQLAARKGLVPVTKPTFVIGEDSATVATFYKEVGEAAEVAVKMISTQNSFGPEDKQYALDAIKRFDDVINVSLNIQHHINVKCFPEDEQQAMH